MHLRKKTKIVCTIGPATSSEEKLVQLLEAGMNVMRLNFSHGDFAEHQVKVDNLKKAIAKTGIRAAVMQDLGGPKIRTGEFSTEFITLKNGHTVILTTEKIVGDEKKMSVNYAPLPKEVAKGSFILIHDGKVKLQVMDIKGNEISCKVIVGGTIKGRRGINLPGAHLSISSITEKDKKDFEFGIKNKVDFIAFSFVRKADDIKLLREMLKKAKSEAKIIAKLEDTEGLENLDEIIALSDGVMVARGDLAIEIGAENVPLVQKMIIQKCNKLGKVVITATQMLESMIKTAVPTRAEVSDIANAIVDGTDAIMLSEESSTGDFPVEAVKVMTKVALNIESGFLRKPDFLPIQHTLVADAVTSSVVDTARDLELKCIVVLTFNGTSARLISRLKPNQFIIAFTPSEKTHNQLLMSYGCYPVMMKKVEHLRDAHIPIREFLVKNKFAKKGDKYVLTAGTPLGKAISTNTLIVETL